MGWDAREADPFAAGCLLAPAAMHVDAAEERDALAMVRRFAKRAGFDLVMVGWTPYPKLGPHSRVSFLVKLAGCRSNQEVIDRIEAICAHVVEAEGLKAAYVNCLFNDDGSFFYDRIFDTRKTPFTFEGALWFDIEINTHPDEQRELREAVG